MKAFLALASALALVLVSGVSNAAKTTYTATLNGAQEVPPTTSTATAVATLEHNDQGDTLKGDIVVTGLTPAQLEAQHFHKAACGASAPAEGGGLAITGTMGGNGKITVDATLDAAQLTALKAGNLYLNLHTRANPNGEIRGQVFAMGSTATCPSADAGAPADAGKDSSAPGSSGTSGATTSGGSNGATTTRDDAGTTDEGSGGDDGGCSTTGGSEGSGNGLALGALAGLGLAIVLRARKKR